MSVKGEGAGMAGSDPQAMLVGIVCGLVTVAIWALWIVGTRAAATHGIPAPWLAVMRFVPPAVLLSPFWLRVGLLPKGVRLADLALMVAGSGIVFFLLAANGAHFVAAGAVGILLPGTMPLFAALLARLVTGERFSPARRLGLLLIAGADVLILAGAVGGLGVTSVGALMLPAAAFCWGAYTIAFHRSRMSPQAAVGLIAVWSLFFALPLALWSGFDAVAALPMHEILMQLVLQGVLTSVVALYCYGVAVRNLGASRAAAITALAPALAAMLAVPLLGEHIDAVLALGIVAAILGVLLASGIVGRRRA